MPLLESELVFALCEQFKVEVVIINQSEKPLSRDEEQVEDVLDVVSVFLARLHGVPKWEEHVLLEKLRQAAERL